MLYNVDLIRLGVSETCDQSWKQYQIQTLKTQDAAIRTVPKVRAVWSMASVCSFLPGVTDSFLVHQQLHCKMSWERREYGVKIFQVGCL